MHVMQYDYEKSMYLCTIHGQECLKIFKTTFRGRGEFCNCSFRLHPGCFYFSLVVFSSSTRISVLFLIIIIS